MLSLLEELLHDFICQLFRSDAMYSNDIVLVWVVCIETSVLHTRITKQNDEVIRIRLCYLLRNTQNGHTLKIATQTHIIVCVKPTASVHN